MDNISIHRVWLCRCQITSLKARLQTTLCSKAKVKIYFSRCNCTATKVSITMLEELSTTEARLSDRVTTTTKWLTKKSRSDLTVEVENQTPSKLRRKRLLMAKVKNAARNNFPSYSLRNKLPRCFRSETDSLQRIFCSNFFKRPLF